VLHREAVVTTVVPATAAAVTTGVGPEEVPGEEDRADDEDDACHDADPRGHRVESTVAWSLGNHGGRSRGRRISGGQWACRGL
jgi:hypothetical protein